MQTKDIISKQTIGHLAGDIATLLLGLDIDTNSVELLDTEQQRVEIRRADLVARMHQRVNGTSFILHLEIQNSNDEKGFRDYLGMLEVLSENRNLQPQIKEAEKMLTKVNVENLPSFQIGLEAGLERGMEQGIEKGMEQGAMRERLRLAQQLIGLLDEQTIADKTGLSLEEVRQLTLH